jgi:hypothetical protein
MRATSPTVERLAEVVVRAEFEPRLVARLPLAVAIMIGVLFPFDLSSLQMENPSFPGSMTSSRITSHRPFKALLSPTMPSVHDSNS